MKDQSIKTNTPETPISVELELNRTVSYATQENNVPVLRLLRIWNNTNSVMENVQVCLDTEPRLAIPIEKTISTIGPGKAYSLDHVDITLPPEFLFSLTERTAVVVQVTVTTGEHTVQESEKIVLLPNDEWGGISESPETVAAFVMPDHPALESILRTAAQILKGWTGDASLSGYRSKDKKRIGLIINAINAALRRSGIHYVHKLGSFEEPGQKIQTPDRILESKGGTCLDLAILAAACLEKAGLHPLICFTREHAFPGVWLKEECFPDCLIDDVLTLKKLIQQNEIWVFEATLVASDPPVRFEVAMSEAKRLLDDHNAFLCAVDICRSRKSCIRPLPTGSETVVASQPTEPSDADDLDLELTSVSSDLDEDTVEPQVEESPASRLDIWKRKLLDLTTRNRLLNFKETKKTLPVLYPDLASLEDALADGDWFHIEPRPTDVNSSRPGGATVYPASTGTTDLEELVREKLEKHRLVVDTPEDEAERRLLEIYRHARTTLEETGANTLYLALGFLCWYESSDSNEERLAPIILVPLEIERTAVYGKFHVRQGDDDPMVNITLLEKLKYDTGLSIQGMDPIPKDEHGIHVRKIVDAFRQAVTEIDRRWKVVEKAYIGHFSFTKFLMWRDLEERTEDILQNRIVSHLVNTPLERFGSDSDHELPDPEKLDEELSPHEVFCPLDADSSQLAAVRAAAIGKSFVLHGPPGTGKSQTITNMIANALANGKTVLFISEKKAALDVVHKRLVESGLGEFSLELHSNKSRKKDILDQLGAGLRELTAKSSKDWRYLADRLAKLRNELNAYVRALHQPRETEESVFQGLSKLIGLRDVDHVPLGWPADKAIDRESLDRLRDVVRELQLAASAITHPSESIWSPVRKEEWSNAWCDNVRSSLSQLRATCTELRKSAQATGHLLGMERNDCSWLELYTLYSIAKTLLESPAIPPAMLTTPDWHKWKAQVTEWIEHGKKRDTLRSQLYERYTPRLLELDLDGLREQLVSAQTSWFLKRSVMQIIVRKSLQRVAKPGQIIELCLMLQDIENACALRAEENHLNKVSNSARELLGAAWQSGEADWNAIAQMRDTASSLRQLAVQLAGTDVELASTVRHCLSRLVSDGHEQLSRHGPIGQLLADYIDKAEAFAKARKTVESNLSLDPQEAGGDVSDPNWLVSVVNRIDQWSNQLEELRAWCHWRAVRHQAIDLDLKALVDAYEHNGLPVDKIGQTFERSYYQWWVYQATDRDPVLCNFFSKEFEDKIQQFRETDEQYMKLTRDEIRARLAARSPARGQNSPEYCNEISFLHREILRRRGHKPIRQLLQKIPNLLPRLKPCLLMSPISVAQYLDTAHPPFDLVIIDEASQMPVWDAIGAIARGRQAVIVGDPKQLPPTDFFTRSDDPDTDGEDEVHEVESILEECIAANLPQMYLKWHYRSLHESLIAFSNFHYYNNKLLTFPSPSNEKHVSFKLVEGVYDRAKSRTNRAEAIAIVEEIVRRLKNPKLSKLSIGIVTFNINQQELIEDLLDEARRKNREFEKFFNSSKHPKGEPIFVKNLETVQGDERDVILFSICYGPDADGHISLNFGPLNNKGGERRLNVAITRARREIIVFSTIRAEDIDPSRSQAQGARDLKNFLDYAERGVAALHEHCSFDLRGECESPFEQQVCEALKNRGHIVHSQVGCSKYRIDLAVVDPEHPGRYLLAIECDGANYHSAKTARDRDRLREMVLRNRGWRLHRVWSTDWWKNPDSELDRIEKAIEEAKASVSPIHEETKILDDSQQPAPSSTSISSPPLHPADQNMQQYIPYEVTELYGDLKDFYDDHTK